MELIISSIIPNNKNESPLNSVKRKRKIVQSHLQTRTAVTEEKMEEGSVSFMLLDGGIFGAITREILGRFAEGNIFPL
jgi:hypothetical protein